MLCNRQFKTNVFVSDIPKRYFKNKVFLEILEIKYA